MLNDKQQVIDWLVHIANDAESFQCHYYSDSEIQGLAQDALLLIAQCKDCNLQRAENWHEK